jgi:hypothetical protein
VQSCIGKRTMIFNFIGRRRNSGLVYLKLGNRIFQREDVR